MTEPTSDVAPAVSPGAMSGAAADPTDQPIPIWPEGVLALAAGITLLVIGLRHRAYLQRKAQELQRAVDEFQRHGGMEDLTHVARQAGELLKGAATGG